MKRTRTPATSPRPPLAMTKAIAELRERFQRHGCFRSPNPDRRETERADYKKGYEVRLVADDKRDLARLRRLLVAAGFKPGKAYPKHSQMIQPIYGRDAVERFRAMIR